jgi:hypothetical protein
LKLFSHTAFAHLCCSLPLLFRELQELRRFRIVFLQKYNGAGPEILPDDVLVSPRVHIHSHSGDLSQVL